MPTLTCPCQEEPFPADWDGDDQPCVTCGRRASESDPVGYAEAVARLRDESNAETAL